jgi:hypothetical protein
MMPSAWRKDLLVKLTIAFVSACFAVFLVYSVMLCTVGYRFYSYVKASAGWEGKVHRADPVLGFRPIPETIGAQTFPLGPKIPLRYDERGFRAPLIASSSTVQKPQLLFLGCSFTFGAGVRAEEAFPYLVGEQLHGTAFNAGVCSYGYTQMLIRAAELIPKLRPDYVIFQVSPWLLSRAIDPYVPSYFGDLPVSSICLDRSTATPRFIPPPFYTMIFDIPVDAYRETPRSAFEFISFLARVAIPLAVHDDLGELRAAYTQNECATNADPKRIEAFVFERIRSITQSSGSQLYFLRLNLELESPADSLPPGETIDGSKELWDRLPEQTTAAFQRAYGIWRGPIVDEHPNPAAHQIIAGAIVKAITAREHKRTLSSSND